VDGVAKRARGNRPVVSARRRRTPPTAEAAPSRLASACYGDSGSPLFLGGSNVQAALFHTTAGPCTGTAYHQRLDTPAEQAFLAPYLPRRHCAHRGHRARR
jgi:hypothetical protein